MKKILLTISCMLLSAAVAFSQDLNEATQTAMEAQEAFNAKNFTEALAGFQKALGLAEACGEEGADLIGQCKNAIPQIAMSIAKEKINAQEYDGGIEALNNALSLAEKYGVADILQEATELIPAVKQQKANQLFAAAEELYQAGKLDEALEAFNIAKENGSENAISRILTIGLKKASTLYQGGQLSEAFEAANSIFTNEEASDGLKKNAVAIIAGVTQKAAASNKLADAGKYFNTLSEIDPDNSKIGVLAYTIGAMYYKAKNTAQAKSWLQKAVNDPKVGANAKQLLSAIK